jgi:hypothetical protein
VPSDPTDDQFRGRATHKKEHAYFFEASAYEDDSICTSERDYEENLAATGAIGSDAVDTSR